MVAGVGTRISDFCRALWGPMVSRAAAYNRPVPAQNPHEELKDRLGAFSLFQGLAGETLALLAGASRRRECAPGEVVFMEGEPTQGLYILESGWVRVVKTSEQGREQVLQFAAPLVVRAGIVDPDDVRMAQRPGDPDFPLEPFLRIVIVDGAQQLDGDLAFDERVAREVDDAHAAPTETADHFVSSNLRRNVLGHVCPGTDAPWVPSLKCSAGGDDSRAIARRQGRPACQARRYARAAG